MNAPVKERVERPAAMVFEAAKDDLLQAAKSAKQLRALDEFERIQLLSLCAWIANKVETLPEAAG